MASFKDSYTGKHEDVAIVFGRFQPIHKGHESVIDIVNENEEVPVVLAMVDETNILENVYDNPLTIEEAEELIEKSVGDKIAGVINVSGYDISSLFEVCKEYEINPISIYAGSDDFTGPIMEQVNDGLPESVNVDIYEVSKLDEDLTGSDVRDSVRKGDFVGFSAQTVNLDENDFNLLKRKI